MSKEIKIGKRSVPVTDEVYQEYYKMKRRERYMEKDIKEGRIDVDMEEEKVTFLPSKEDSLHRLMDLGADFAQEQLVEELIVDKATIKTAFNANFERVALMRYFSRTLGRKVYLDPSSWRCSEVQAAMLGLPLHLEGVAKVLRLDAQKMNEGKALIRYFCLPCKPTAANGGRSRNLPHHAPDKWELFKQYNIRDVEVELEIRQKIYHKISDICISMKALEHLEMPEIVFNKVEVELSENEMKLYRKLERDLLLPLNESDIDAANAAVLSNKLLQMAGGTVYDEYGDVHQIHDRKLDALEDLIEAANGKPVLIYYGFKHEKNCLLNFRHLLLC